jgi:hypothetical protein
LNEDSRWWTGEMASETKKIDEFVGKFNEKKKTIVDLKMTVRGR